MTRIALSFALGILISSGVASAIYAVTEPEVIDCESPATEPVAGIPRGECCDEVEC